MFPVSRSFPVSTSTAAPSALSRTRPGRRVELSRENTNVRSLAISLKEKRSVMLLCQDALSALEAAIAEEPAPSRPVRPR